LRKEGITLLRAEMDAIHNCSEIPCPEFDADTDTIMQSVSGGERIYRHFRFRGFKRLKEVRLVEEDW